LHGNLLFIQALYLQRVRRHAGKQPRQQSGKHEKQAFAEEFFHARHDT